MIAEENVFRNIFANNNITDSRLYNFALDAIGKLQANNNHTALANTLALAAAELGKEIGEVSSSIAVQKSSTQTNNQVLAAFKKYMSENEGVIRQALGGYQSTGYIQMYPQGINQYSSATKLKMVPLLKQVFDAASAYSNVLPAPMVTQLKAFTQQWNDSRVAQNAQKGSVEENRTERSINRQTLETSLLVAVYTIGIAYPGNVAACSSFFNFSLLDAPSRRNRKVVTPVVGN